LNKRGEKLKVLHLIETLGSGGAERLLHTNLRHIDRNQFESDVATVFSRGDHWRGPIGELGVRVDSLGLASYRDILRGISLLEKRLASDPPDVIHTHLFAANVIGRVAGRRAGLAVISSIHNPEYEPEAVAGASVGIRSKVPCARIVDKITASYGCARMIAVSNYVKETTAARLGYPLEKIDVIYNPVDLSPDTTDRDATLGSIGLENGSFVILNVGRVSPQKGLIDAVRAMRAIVSVNPNAHLVFVGSLADRVYTSQVRDECRAAGLEGSVHLLGERRDVHALLNACDVFLFPSLFEGLGIALAEAMTVGRACVASRIRPLDEFVEDGVNGILVEPGSPERISEAVISLMREDEKRRELGEAASVTAGQMFQPEPAARQLENAYRSVVRK
jgi:glycosyltransferase involved in cell wall biosynthesis